MKQVIAVVLMLFPLLPMALLLRQLTKTGAWFFTWLRGCAIVLLVGACALLSLTAFEVSRLDHIPLGKTIAEIHIDDAVEESLVTIKFEEHEKSVLMNGDAVKVSARAMQFSGPLKNILPDTFIKVEQLENRYFEFKTDDNPKSLPIDKRALALPLVQAQFDGWLVLDALKSPLEKIGVERSSVSAEYIPMVKGAIYHLVWQGYGMSVVPANTHAQEGLGLSESTADQTGHATLSQTTLGAR